MFIIKIEKLHTFDFISYFNRTIKFSTTRNIAASSSVFNRKVQLRGTIAHYARPFHTERDRFTLRGTISHCAEPCHNAQDHFTLHGTKSHCEAEQLRRNIADKSFCFVSVTNFGNKLRPGNFSSSILFN